MPQRPQHDFDEESEQERFLHESSVSDQMTLLKRFGRKKNVKQASNHMTVIPQEITQQSDINVADKDHVAPDLRVTTRPPSSRPALAGIPRRLTTQRQGSERRERLIPHEECEHEQRIGFDSRKRALSARPHEREVLDVPIPRAASPDILDPIQDGIKYASENADPQLDLLTSDRDSMHSHDSSVSDLEADRLHSFAPFMPSDQCDPNIQKLSQALGNGLERAGGGLDALWTLNLSMHFRDNSNREKFFVTYAERRNLWRRITISCDYRDAPAHSLEEDLKTLHYQRDKSAKIYEAIRESLPDIAFFDTVTNLKLETADGRLHVHVTEDVNEIIHHPTLGAIAHLQRLGCSLIPESGICIESHLSGFVYKVSVNGQKWVMKEIPSPDTVEEFLYEANALFTLNRSPHVIDFRGVVTDDECTRIKGLVISFASGGALVDLLYDGVDTPLSWPRREKWAVQIIRGLADIHEAGFVQGDFTLSNIVIDANDDAQIIDINRRGCPMGWEPPELKGLIRSGQRIFMYIGAKTDLWQLGMVLWALAMHDSEPERADDDLDFDDEDESIAHVGPMFREVVRTCLAPDPAQRKSATELLGMLDRSVWGNQTSPQRQIQASTETEELGLIRRGGRSTFGHGNVIGNSMTRQQLDEIEQGFGLPMHQDSGFGEFILDADEASVAQLPNTMAKPSFHNGTAGAHIPNELIGVGAIANDGPYEGELQIEEDED